MAQSLNPNGTIQSIAIDNALHDISAHLDNNGFVRMTLGERTKLQFIASNATCLFINISTISGTIPFGATSCAGNNDLELAGSNSIIWRYDGFRIMPDMNLPSSVRHSHYYELIPITSNYQNYTTTTLKTAYISGSLRVYINGVRLNPNANVYYAAGQPSSVTWTPLSYTEGNATNGIVTGGDFRLSSPISLGVSIIIDFDVSYA